MEGWLSFRIASIAWDRQLLGWFDYNQSRLAYCSRAILRPVIPPPKIYGFHRLYSGRPTIEIVKTRFVRWCPPSTGLFPFTRFRDKRNTLFSPAVSYDGKSPKRTTFWDEVFVAIEYDIAFMKNDEHWYLTNGCRTLKRNTRARLYVGRLLP